jgi:hypothetical protein
LRSRNRSGRHCIERRVWRCVIGMIELIDGFRLGVSSRKTGSVSSAMSIPTAYRTQR